MLFAAPKKVSLLFLSLVNYFIYLHIRVSNGELQDSIFLSHH